MKRLSFLALFVIIFFCAPKTTYAVSLSIDSAPPHINLPEFEVTFTVSGAKPATNYFRVLVYKENTSVYVAKTWNGNIWYDGGDGKQYFPLTVTHKTTGTIKAHIFDNIENGEYLVLVKRYTQSGNAASDDETPVRTTVDIPHESPTTQPVPHTTTPTQRPTVTPTIAPSVLPTIIEEMSPSPSASSSPVVLAVEASSEPEETLSPDQIRAPVEPMPAEKNSTLLMSGVALCLVGAGILIYGGLSFLFTNRNWYTRVHSS